MRILFGLISSIPAFIILLLVTILLWSMFAKINPEEVDDQIEASVIRALIVARGSKGASLAEIKRE